MTSTVAPPRGVKVAVVTSTAALICVYLFGVPGVPGIGWGLWAQYRIDLDVYRLGARALLDGTTLYGPGFPTTGFGLDLPFIYPPLAAVLFVPLAVIPMPVASFVVTVTSGLLALWLYAQTQRLLDASSHGWWLAAAVPVVLVLDPVRMTLMLGQVNILLLAVVAIDTMGGADRRSRGVLVGLAAAVKLTPLVFVVWFLIRGDRRAAATAGATFVGATVLGHLIAPAESVQYWTTQLFRLDPMLSPATIGNQNLRAVAERLGLDPPGATALWLVLAAGTAVLAVVAARRCVRAGEPLLGVLMIAIGGLLVSPISWSHHWVWALPVLPMLLHLGRRHPVPRQLAVSGLAMFAAGPQWLLYRVDGHHGEWAPWQHILAATSVIWGIVLVATVAWNVERWTNRSFTQVPRETLSERDGHAGRTVSCGAGLAGLGRRRQRVDDHRPGPPVGGERPGHRRGGGAGARRVGLEVEPDLVLGVGVGRVDARRHRVG